MPKNTKTKGLIARGYGLSYHDDKRTVAMSPARFAEGAAIVLPKEILKEYWENYSDTEFSELEEKVMEKKGVKKLLDDGIEEIYEGGTVVDAKVKGRRHGGRGYPQDYCVINKGIQMKDGDINNLYTIGCGCEDHVYSKISDESRVYSSACAHIAALVEAYDMKELLPEIEEKITTCKPLLDGEIAVPYKFSERPDLIVEELERRYVNGDKLLDIDVDFLENEDIVTSQFEKGIQKGKVTFNCMKDCENYSGTVNHFMGLYTRELIDMGLTRKGIVKEVDDNCYWNFEVNDDFDVRLIPNERELHSSEDDVNLADPESKSSVYLLFSIYDRDLIDKYQKIDDEVLNEQYHLEDGLSLDPMRRRPRIWESAQIGKNLSSMVNSTIEEIERAKKNEIKSKV